MGICSIIIFSYVVLHDFFYVIKFMISQQPPSTQVTSFCVPSAAQNRWIAEMRNP